MEKISQKKLYIIIGIIVIAAFFRLANIDSEEVMSDEGNYALRGIGWNDFMQSSTFTTPWNWYMEKPALPLWTQLSFNDHPPLHFANIWLSSHIFGVHLWSVRLPSVIYAIASILLVILVLAKMGFERGAIFAGIFMAVLPWHIFISRRAIQEPMVIFFFLLSCYWLLKMDEKENTIMRWAALGIILGLGVLTKYSFVVIFPVLLFFIIKNAWYKKNNFYVACVAFLVVTLPVLIYNAFLFNDRGHLDLQLSRFLKMDTSADWRASVQGIWQGSASSILTYFKNHFFWISPGISMIIIAGLILGLKKIKENFKAFFMSYGMILFTGIFASLTLGDFGRSSIIIPFVAMAFGIGAENFLSKKKNAYAYILHLSIILIVAGSLMDRFAVTQFPKQIFSTFYEKPAGYDSWERWKNKNFTISLKPTHFISLKDWMKHTNNLIKETDAPIIVYDQRFIWFGANWYFYKDTFYSDNTPIIHSGLADGFIVNNDIKGREVYFIEAGKSTMDAKPNFDPGSLIIYNKIRALAEKQNIEPIILRNNENTEAFIVWKAIWDNAGDIAKK